MWIANPSAESSVALKTWRPILAAHILAIRLKASDEAAVADD